ncbi:kinase-like protein, partial [Ceratobasidium sp. AG-I]
HPNVLKMLGLVEFRDQIGMVSQWMEEGNLPHYLEREPGADRPNICMQVAEGLSYLHKCGVVHGDLKGANILMSDSGVPLLADFGNATLEMCSLQFTRTSSNHNYTLRWTAPEVYLEMGAPTVEADIYAMGMVREIITGSIPYRGWSERAVNFRIAGGAIPERPEDCIPGTNEAGNAIWLMLTRCWARDPESRPTIIEVKDMVSVCNLGSYIVILTFLGRCERSGLRICPHHINQ